jgi:putative ATPase
MMEQLSLFDDRAAVGPLASRLRPSGLEEFVGQKHLLGEGKVLRRIIDQDMVCSMIFWGPPGVGKTTLARIIANRTRASFVDFSAVTSGIKEIKEVMAQAERDRHIGLRTLVFVDEIHRFNKAQQDAFLPYVEKGSIILIGATTENPSFEINAALLSRCKVFVLQALQSDDLVMLLHHALTSPLGLGDQRIGITEDMLRMIAQFANGDGEYSYDVLDGFPIHEEHTQVYPVRPGEEVVLASDGYPELFGNLAESEAVIREVKETDPMCMFRFKGPKGIAPGFHSFDDRTYLRFILEED